MGNVRFENVSSLNRSTKDDKNHHFKQPARSRQHVCQKCQQEGRKNLRFWEKTSLEPRGLELFSLMCNQIPHAFACRSEYTNIGIMSKPYLNMNHLAQHNLSGRTHIIESALTMKNCLVITEPVHETRKQRKTIFRGPLRPSKNYTLRYTETAAISALWRRMYLS